MRALSLCAPEPPNRLRELRQQIAGYRRSIPALERRLKKARNTEPDTPEIRAALDGAALKIAQAKEDLAALESEAKGLSRTLGKVR